VIIGKASTPEPGAGSQAFTAVFGVARNPWGTRMTPGGSSGGAAAAAGLLPFADGSGLAASVRNPAAVCPLAGLRTTPGTIHCILPAASARLAHSRDANAARDIAVPPPGAGSEPG
jgi:amidase